MINPSEPLLLDISAWVRYLRPRDALDLKAAVRDALAQDRVATCWVVRAELLVGARDSAAFDTLRDVLLGVPDSPIMETLWEEAARLGFHLRKQGLLVPLPDLVIAQCAISTERVLWHADADFERIRGLSSLRTRHWPATD